MKIQSFAPLSWVKRQFTEVNNNLAKLVGEEKYIGKIGGKDVYESTVETNVNITTSATSWTAVDIQHGIQNIDEVYGFSMFLKKTNCYSLPHFSNGTVTTHTTICNKTTLSFAHKGTTWGGYIAVCTIRYTKI